MPPPASRFAATNGSTKSTARRPRPLRAGITLSGAPGERWGRRSAPSSQNEREKFTRCPRCKAPTRIRKLPLLIHVEHPDGPRLTILMRCWRWGLRPPIGEHLDATFKPVGEILFEAGDVEKRSSGFDIDEKINVAVRSIIAARHGAEHTDMSDA